MSAFLIAGLVAGLLFVVKRWLDTRAERTELERQVALLKRRLAEIRR